MRRREPRYDVPNKAPDGPLRLVQELLNTGDREHGREWLDSPEALHSWLLERDLVGRSDRITRADLARTLETREALRELVRTRSGVPAGEAAIALLDDVAGAAQLTIRFDAGGAASLEPAAAGAAGALGRILAHVLAASIDGSWERLKACPNCSWAFYDYSPNRSAKWCSMLLCGNRAKVRDYYRRRSERDPVVIRRFTNC